MEIVTSRRSFLRDAVAFGVAATCAQPSPSVEAGGAERLRIGLLSDLHLEDAETVDKLEKALVVYRDQSVDGVLICGDLSDHGILPELKLLADAWKKVFPGDRLPDGSHVERLFLYGDHDTGGYAHTKGFFNSGEKLMERYGVPYEKISAWAIRSKAKKVWEDAFGEPWAPIVRKTVKGYDFVLANFTVEGSNGGNMTPGMERFYETYRPDPSKPFFHAQHRVYRQTVGGPAAWGQDDGSAGRILSRYANCVAFCGHGHLSATDEKAIWQGAFTAIEVPSLRYVLFAGDHENAGVSDLRKKAGIQAQMGVLPSHEALQGMLMVVYDREIGIKRLEFGTSNELGPVWRIPLDTASRPYAPSERRRNDVAPRFPRDAVVEVSELRQDGLGNGRHRLEVVFPLAQPTGCSPRAFDYEVTAIALQPGGAASPVLHKVYSPRAFDSISRDRGPGRCIFSFSEFPDGVRNFHVEVVPLTAFGLRGEPIVADYVVKTED